MPPKLPKTPPNALLTVVLLILLGIIVWICGDWTWSRPCGGCVDKMHLLMIGQCSACPTLTSSISDRLCEDCARTKGVCRHCGGKSALILDPRPAW